MWIQVRSMDGSKSIRLDGLSKLTRINDLRNRLVEKFDVTPDRQRLFYRGKQLEDGYTLFDYDVGLNDIIQIIIRAPAVQKRKNEDESSSGDESTSSNKENKLETPSVSGTSSQSCKYYKVGELVDARDLTNGAWFEAKIMKIVCKSCCPDDKTKSPADSSNRQLKKSINNDNCDVVNSMKCNHGSKKSDDFVYYVTFETYDDDEPTPLCFKDIRPRAKTLLKLEDVEKGSIVMVNHNLEEPSERGYWFDCRVEEVTDKELIGTLYIDSDSTPVENCHIIFTDEIFKIEKPVMVSHRSTEEEQLMVEGPPIKRQNKPECSFCKDEPRRKCIHCACHICGGKDSPDKQVLCDECDMAYHIWCLDPPLESVPDDDDWYCPDCKNDETEVVRAGEKLKESKKKARMASANKSTKRDWGKGMACVGRTKECTIVPPNHFGAIPGVEVGMMWKFRVQVSEAGVHRPHVAGIHGRETDGAFSIVLSGGYEDDVDYGEQFTYTGSGGRDLSGNKRTAEQSCDQTLTRMNKALASNCAAPLDTKVGAEAKQWKDGKPVRVVRNCKGRKHSEYCPEEGNRYDGLYKVVKYWPETGKSGFLVWRYLLRRDDPAPAPWTKQGKKRAKQLGFVMQYPEGYLQSVEEKKENEDHNNTNIRKRKRGREDTPSPNPKKAKVLAYSLPSDIKKLIDNDENNKKIWDECLECLPEGKPNFLKKVEELFSCICCQEVVFDPVTTECCHNICKSCLQRSFKAEVYNCPMCRNDLGKDYAITTNKHLNKVLTNLFPGYEAGR